MWSRQNEFSSDWTWSREQKSSLSQCTLLHFGGLKADWRRVNGPWEKFALLQLGQKLNHHKVLGNLISPEPENYSQKKKLNKSVEYIPNRSLTRYITIGIVKGMVCIHCKLLLSYKDNDELWEANFPWTQVFMTLANPQAIKSLEQCFYGRVILSTIFVFIYAKPFYFYTTPYFNIF